MPFFVVDEQPKIGDITKIIVTCIGNLQSEFDETVLSTSAADIFSSAARSS